MRKLSRWSVPRVQQLEDRTLLAAGTLAHVFAGFDGALATAAASQRILINIAAPDFTLNAVGTVSLGFLLKQGAGSSLDPAAVQVRNAAGTLVTPSYSNPDLAGYTQSLVVAPLAAGSYTLTVSSDRGTAGDFHLDVFLAGDVDGDHSVTLADGQAIRAIYGVSSASPSYMATADTNLDGWVNAYDYAQWRANYGDSTRIRPLALTIAAPTGATLQPNGSYLTQAAQVQVTATTTPGLSVSLETGSDGLFDEGTQTADASGHVTFSVPLPLGATTIQTRAGDGFGQQRLAALSITRQSALQVTARLADDTAPGGGTNGDGITSDPAVTGSATPANAVATFRAGLDATAAANFVSVLTDLHADGTFTLSGARLQQLFGPLADGAHTLHLLATDGASGTAAADVPFTLDTQPPALQTSSPAPLTNHNVTLSGQVMDALSGVAALTAQVDGGAVANVSFNPGTGAFTFTTALPLDGSADGGHTLHLVGTDVAGNTAAAALTFTLDTIPPIAPVFDLSTTSITTASAVHQTAAARVLLVGQTDPNVGVALLQTGATTVSSNTGAFEFPDVMLAVGGNPFTVQATDAAGNTSSYSLTITRTAATGAPNAVIAWNQAALSAIQLDASDPPHASRALAMVQAAVYDAVNAIDGTPAYYVKIAAPAGASGEAAVDAAAHSVLSYLYPAQQANFDALLATRLGGVPSGQSTTDGLTVGQAVGNAIIALRAHDGFDTFVDYTPQSGAGQWQPTAPAYAEALDPQWATLQPFAMTGDSQFRPAGPPALTSQQWADAVNKTESLGSATSTTRTADQTQIAHFWADGAGTVTPPGQWNVIAGTVAQQQGDSLAADARLFAELDVALGDATIVAWDAKYTYTAWRPITVIQSGGDGVNPAVQADPNWTPLLITPNFPEYVAGHSTFSATAAAVLDSYFGNNVGFTETSAGFTRSFNSFDQAAAEAGESRIYGGIHFEFSNQDGQAAGRALGNYVVQTFAVSTDTQPPKVTLDNVLPSGAGKTNVSITGQVTDNLSGVAKLEVQVDQGAYAALAFDGTGRFSFPTAFALDGSADGSHTVNLRATDAAGNVAAPVAFTFALDTQAPAVTITAPAANASLTAGAHLTGTASGTGSALTALSYAFDNGPSMPVGFDPTSGAFSQALDLSKLVTGAHSLTVTAQDAAGNTSTTSVALTLPATVPLTVTDYQPSNGANDIGSTYRPKVTFSRPINTSTLNANNFYATDTTGGKLAATIVPSDDGTYAWLFLTNPMPGASEITVTVDGSTIKAADGSLLDAAGTGTAGSKLTFSFSTVSEAFVPGTTLSGIVADPGPDLIPGTVDDVKAGPDGVLMTGDDVYLLPIANAKVYILGHEDQPVYTDAQGRFSFSSVPTGDVKLGIDGRTATNAPAGYYFPEMVMDLTIRPGVANTVMGSMGTEQQQQATAQVQGVYLPRVLSSILQTVSSTQTTEIGVSPQAAPDLTPQQQSELKIDVAPGSLVGMNGQKMSSGQVGISTVPPQLVMDMLPPGVMQHTFDITIQAPGVATFATPATMTFPNVFHAAPGTKLNFLSFNHTTGRLEIDGTATVSADGKTVTTDPGTGITHPGWHGLTPPGTDASPNADHADVTVEVKGGLLGDVIPVNLQQVTNLTNFVFDGVGLGSGQLALYTGWDVDLLNTGIFYFVPDTQSTNTVQLWFQADNPATGNQQLTVLVEFKTLACGYSPFSLSGPVGEVEKNSGNNALDVYKVQQRLKFLGFPSANGTPLAVDGIDDSATDQAIRLFQSTVWPIQTGSLAGNPMNEATVDGVVLSKPVVEPPQPQDPSDVDYLAWLNASNAPQWKELIDPDPPAIPFGWRDHPQGAFDILPSEDIPNNNKSRTGKTPQTERFGTGWAISVIQYATASAFPVVGTELIGAISANGYTQQHHEHKSGLDIDVEYRNLVTGQGPGLNASEQVILEEMLAFYHAGQALGIPVPRIIVGSGRIADVFNQIIQSLLIDASVSTAGVAVFDSKGGHSTHFHVDLAPPRRGPAAHQPDVTVKLLGDDPAFSSDPRLYYRFVLPSGFQVAGRSDPAGHFSVFLPPSTEYTAYYYQPSTNQSGIYRGRTNGSGVATDLGTIVLNQIGGTDSDGDGIPDVGEIAIGTNPKLYSTTGDGISDGAKVAMGLDPLAGGAFPTGVIAALQLNGEVQQVVLEGSALDPKGQTAYVATGSYGLAIVDASQFTRPVVLSQLKLPGNATDVSVDPNLQIAAVADNGGLQLVDVSNPMQPNLVRTINVSTGLVQVADGIAYLAAGSSVEAFDLVTGGYLQTLALPGSTITGLARDGSFLCTLDSANTLQVIDMSGSQMIRRGSVALASGVTLAAGSGALFVANGVAYVGVTRYLNTGGLGVLSGYITADVSNPDVPKALSGLPSSDAAGQAVVSNGSGIALTVGADFNGPAVDVFNASNPSTTGQFLTRFALPTPALDVAIGEGIAFIADANGGLQVVNYLPFDTKGVPPTVSISSPLTGPSAVEGSSIPITVSAQDDVQVRNVAFLVNGQVVANDVSAPYNFEAITPSLASGATTVSVQVEVTDTGGNSSLSNVLTYQIVQDTTPPAIVSMSPANGGAGPEGLQALTIQFSKPMDASTVTANTFQLRDAAGNGIPLVNAQLRSDDQLLQLAYAPLALGNYQLVINAPAVTDRAGRALGAASVVSNFQLVPQGLVSWYKADGDATDSVGFSNGILENGATFAPGKSGQAFSLDGVNSFVQVSNPPLLTSAITVEAWIDPQVPPSGGGWIYSLRRPFITEGFSFAVNSNGSIAITLRTTTSPTVSGSVLVSPANTVVFGVFQNIVASYDSATEQVRLYVNGFAVPLTTVFGPATLTGQLFPVTNLFIGQRQASNTSEGVGGGAHYKGLIDQLEVFNRPLTASELQVIAQSAGMVKQGPVSLWSAEGTANDSVSGNNGTLADGTYAPGQPGQGFHLDGVDDYVQVPDTPSLQPPTISVATWVKFDSLDAPHSAFPGLQYILFKQNSRTYQFEAYILAEVPYGPGAGGIDFQIASASGQQVGSYSKTSVVAGQFYYVVGTYDGSSVKLYINGLLETQLPASFPLDYGTQPLFFGTSGESYYDGKLNGVLDEVAIYDRALSGDEVLALYNAGGTSKVGQGAVSRWKAEGDAVDSISGSNGILENGASFAPGKTGQAFSFDGVGSSVYVPNPAVPTSAITVDAWIDPAVPPTGAGFIYAQRDPLVTVGFDVWVNGDGSVGIDLRTANNSNGAGSGFASPPNAVAFGQFQNVVATYDSNGGRLTLYVNGFAVPLTNTFGPASLSGVLFPVHNLYIGERQDNNTSEGVSGGGHYKGLIDELEVFNRALSPIELQAIAQSAGMIKQGPVSLWSADGSANDSVGGNNGTLVDGTYAPGQSGQGFHLDGVDDYVRIPNSPSLQPPTISVAAWVKFDTLDSQAPAVPGLQYIVFKQNSRIYNFEGFTLAKYRDGQGVDQFIAVITSATGVQVGVGSTTAVVTGRFYHVAMTYDGNNLRLYVNGLLEAQTQLSAPIDYGTEPIFFGTSGESYFDAKLAGVLDEVAIYDRALSGDEVLALYNAGSGRGGQPQFLAGNPKAPAPDTAVLTREQLQPVVARALADLAAAGYKVSGLGQVGFHLVRLPDSLLGLTYQNTIWIDQTAQGYGWYTDASPNSEAAFTLVTGANEVQAAPGSPAYGHADLLTVVMHEMGHVLGFASIDAGILGHDWMTATLGTGVRRYPDAVAGAAGTSVTPPPGGATSAGSASVAPLPDAAVLRPAAGNLTPAQASDSALPSGVLLLSSPGTVPVIATASRPAPAARQLAGPSTVAVPAQRPQDAGAIFPRDVPLVSGRRSRDPDAIDAVFGNPLGWRGTQS